MAGPLEGAITSYVQDVRGVYVLGLPNEIGRGLRRRQKLAGKLPWIFPDERSK